MTLKPLLAGLLMLPAFVHSQTLAERWASAAPSESGRFTESRTIAGFPKPLVSTGRFEIRRGERILWQTLRPVRNDVLIDRSGLSVRTADGAARPAAAGDEVAKLFFALLSADTAALQRFFDLTETGDTLVATPKSAAERAFVQKIELSGKRAPEHIRVIGAGGEVTDIRITPDPAP